MNGIQFGFCHWTWYLDKQIQHSGLQFVVQKKERNNTRITELNVIWTLITWWKQPIVWLVHVVDNLQTLIYTPFPFRHCSLHVSGPSHCTGILDASLGVEGGCWNLRNHHGPLGLHIISLLILQISWLVFKGVEMTSCVYICVHVCVRARVRV